MRLSLAFAALVAVVPAFANAIPPHTGKAIPISKHAVQTTDDDGVVIRRTLNSLRIRTVSKFGRDATRVPTGVCGRDNGSVADPLIKGPNGFWYGKISVGTPPVDFTVNFDTSSSDLILPGTLCGHTCQGHKIYDPAASSTATDLDRPFAYFYSDGTSFQGEVFTDTVALAGLSVTNQSVGSASQYPSGFESDLIPVDGFIGFAFSKLSVTKTNTFFENLIAQGAIARAEFSLRLAATNAELFLGGSNSDLFTGEFTNMNVTEGVGYWQISIDAVNAGGNRAVASAQAVIDTSTIFISGPELDVVQFYQNIPGSKEATNDVGQGFFTFPCNIDPQVSFTFGGKEFQVPVSAFNTGQATPGSTDCVGGIVASSNIDFWDLGTIFLSNIYMRFDVEKKQVGFATLA